ncbi:hypothetical protein [Streptomyces collinus]|uniref:hypothetical protein n=1 Tax=Streptomyces collinus TaxID=42684 RepID=UPI0036806524
MQRGFGFGAVGAVTIAWFDDGGGVAAPDGLRPGAVGGLPLLRVRVQGSVGLRAVGPEPGPGAGGFDDDERPDAVVTDLVVQGLGVALDRVRRRIRMTPKTPVSKTGRACSTEVSSAAPVEPTPALSTRTSIECRWPVCRHRGSPSPLETDRFPLQ